MAKKNAGEFASLPLEVAADYWEMSRRAADMLVSALKGNPALLLCASAGGTPTGMYACLADRWKQDRGLFAKIRVLQIDEWGGLDRKSPVTCAADLREKLIRPLQIPAARFLSFRTDATNPRSECARVSRWLSAHGPIDFCILGLGLNGHIAMNEPADDLAPHAHVAALAKSSQQHGMLRDLARKPGFGFTLGMRDILSSRQVLLLASGEAKRAVLQHLLEPKGSTRFPASFLWLHPNATVLCDRAAIGRE